MVFLFVILEQIRRFHRGMDIVFLSSFSIGFLFVVWGFLHASHGFSISGVKVSR